MMTRWIKVTVALLFLAGLLATGALGTETRLLLFWPGCALMGAAAVLSVSRWRWRLHSGPADVCLAAALLFAGYFAARQLTSPVTVWAREDLFVLLGCGVAYLLTATVLSHPRWRNGLVVVLFTLLVANLAMGFIHFSGKWSLHLVPQYMRTYGNDRRIGGLFINPNHLGAFLSMMAMLSLGLAGFGRGGATRRLLLLFAAIAAAVGVSLTQSRGAIIGMAAGGLSITLMLLMMVQRAYPHLLVRAMLGILLGGGLLALLLGAVMSGQLQQRFGDGPGPEGDPRALIWRSALAQHAEHPWLGAGARMFYEGCIRLRPADAPSWMRDAQFAHNDWLQALADYGWAGLALVVALFAVHLFNGWRFLRWFADERFPRTASLSGTRLGLAVGACAALVAALAHALVEFHFHVPAVAVTSAALMGVLANPGFESEFWKPRRVWGVRVVSKLALLGCGAAMLRGAFTLGLSDYDREHAKLVGRREDLGHADVALLTRALTRDPANMEAWYERGLARIDDAGGQPVQVARALLEGAASDLGRARKLNPFDPYVAMALGDACDALGRHAEAEKNFADAIRQAPLNMPPRIALGLHYHRLQMWREAEDAFLWAGEAGAERSDEWMDLCRATLAAAMR
jgi:O-antigen ligase